MNCLCSSRMVACFLAALFTLNAASLVQSADPAKPFALLVVDEATGRGVPLVELRAVDQQNWITDSQGYAAIDEPSYRGQKVYFHVRSHGYEYPADGFGFRGQAVEIVAGGQATLKLRRINIAERLYRTTGIGIYADSIKLGKAAPIEQPVLNCQVAGSDSILAALYRERVYWFWGDTNRVGYPLGNFQTTGATSALPGKQGLSPEQGINYRYFAAENGFVKPVAKMPGEGPTWLGGLVVLRDKADRERLYATYTKIKPPLDAYETGLVVWNHEREEFEKVVAFDKDFTKTHGQGHTVLAKDTTGQEYIYFTKPLPLTRVQANAEALADPRRYEGYSCLKAGTRLVNKQLDRDAEGKLVYAWKANTPPLTQPDQQALIKQGLMKPGEALLALCDVESGREFIAHSGSVYYNAFRRRWVLITVEIGGQSSLLGEVWYAEAEAPVGPWVYARKIITHDKYTFYNPKQHPFFDQQDGRVIYFEGTYTHTFSGNPEQTPRYDYNQVMYRLDLADPRLQLPVAMYERSAGQTPGDLTRSSKSGVIAFFAPDRPTSHFLPVFIESENDFPRLMVGEAKQASPSKPAPLFFALAADTKNPPGTTTPLLEFVHSSGRRAYTTDARWTAPDFTRTPKPVCLVWKSPWSHFPGSTAP